MALWLTANTFVMQLLIEGSAMPAASDEIAAPAASLLCTNCSYFSSSTAEAEVTMPVRIDLLGISTGKSAKNRRQVYVIAC